LEEEKVNGYSTNIEKDTLENECYRKVLFTGRKIQLVVMRLKPGEDIPLEVHDDIDQFIRVEEGEAFVTIGDEEFNLKDDDIVIIPAGSKHYVKNTSDKDLKIYTLYATPEHPSGTIHKTQAEAAEAGCRFDVDIAIFRRGRACPSPVSRRRAGTRRAPMDGASGR